MPRKEHGYCDTFLQNLLKKNILFKDYLLKTKSRLNFFFLYITCISYLSSILKKVLILKQFIQHSIPFIDKPKKILLLVHPGWNAGSNVPVMDFTGAWQHKKSGSFTKLAQCTAFQESPRAGKHGSTEGWVGAPIFSTDPPCPILSTFLKIPSEHQR